MQISDPKAITALAHPLRLDLLELLTAIGPATAARCGRILGVPQANCSFHLRQLARYGFVEDAGPGRDRRDSGNGGCPSRADGTESQRGGDEVVPAAAGTSRGRAEARKRSSATQHARTTSPRGRANPDGAALAEHRDRGGRCVRR